MREVLDVEGLPDGFEAIMEYDSDPDLSWLDQEDKDMGEGFTERAKERKEAYDRGDWHMVGIRVRHRCSECGQWHYSPGLWGIESDSDPSFFQEVAIQEANDAAGE